SKKYGAQVKAIQEVFPDWHDDDLVSLLQDTHGSVETAIERITQGQAEQWGSVPSKKSKKPQTAPARGGGRGQRGRGSSRGGAARGGRGHRQTSSSSRPVNGEHHQDPASTGTANADSGPSSTHAWGPSSSAAPWGTDSEHKDPESKPAAEIPKTNGTPVNGTHPPAPVPPPATVATPAQSVKPPPPTKAPAPAAPPAKTWASLLKPKPTPAPV
ncbi:Translation initiation factor, partial [Rhizoctonia solani]